MNKVIIQNDLTIDQLLRLIESIVFTGPIGIEELKAHLRFLAGYIPEPGVLDSVLSYLQEKYTVDLYGFAFCEKDGQFQFISRSPKEIVNH